MKKTLYQVKIAAGAGVEVSMPLMELEFSEKPEVLVLTGIHGDELGALSIIRHMMDSIGNHRLEGKLKILTLSNPLASLEFRREATLNERDLNREFGQTNDEYFSSLVKETKQLASTSNLVITLHQYETTSPNMAAYYRIGPDSTQKAQWRAISALNPELVILADPNTNPAFSQYRTTIDAVLNAHGTPCVMIEASSRIMEDSPRVEALADGIIRTWQSLSNASPRPDDYKGPVVSTRTHLKANAYGLFYPNRDIEYLSSVQEGQIIGNLIALPSLESTPIRSTTSGILIQDRPPSVVGPADYLAVIADPVAPDGM